MPIHDYIYINFEYTQPSRYNVRGARDERIYDVRAVSIYLARGPRRHKNDDGGLFDI